MKDGGDFVLADEALHELRIEDIASLMGTDLRSERFIQWMQIHGDEVHVLLSQRVDETMTHLTICSGNQDRLMTGSIIQIVFLAQSVDLAAFKQFDQLVRFGISDDTSSQKVFRQGRRQHVDAMFRFGIGEKQTHRLG